MFVQTTFVQRVSALTVLALLEGCATGAGLFGNSQSPSFSAAPPAGSVSQSPLPPLAEGQVATAPLRVGGEPVLAGRPTAPPMNDGSAAPTLASLKTSDVLGGWTVNIPGTSCQLFTSLTSWTGGYRAVTTGCDTTDLASVQSWNLDGRQMILKGNSGQPIARLRATAGSRFDGLTATGLPVTVYR